MKRNASAIWKGNLKEGNGFMYVKNSVLNNAQYTYKSRFENGTGTNPEELIAAAHAGCFSMALSNVLGNSGFTPETIETTATVTLEEGTIKSSHLVVKVNVPDISEKKLQECAEDAKANCPVSKALNVEISMELL